MFSVLRLAAVSAALALPMWAHSGAILIVNNAAATSEADTTAAVTNNLTALHIAAGNTVTVVSSLSGPISGYSQVWDVGFNDNAALTATQRGWYADFLNGGGGVFLMGENANFMGRNNSILTLIAELGGGSIGFNGCYDGVQTVHAPFNNPNAVSSVNFAASGCFTSTGTGDWITSRADGSMGAGIAFSVGDLANATAGALTTILDVNFMMNEYDLPNSQNLTKNLIQFVGNEVDPPINVPTPGTLALVGLGLVAVAGLRRRKA